MPLRQLSRTAVFELRVRQRMGPVWPQVTPQTPIDEAVRLLRERGRSSLLVTGGGRLLGILTERDITRRVVFRAPPETEVGQLMSTPVAMVREDDYLFQAIASMRRLGLRHLPVVDASGRPSGSLNLDAALGASQEYLLGLVDRLGHEDSLDGLKQVKAAQTELAASLLDDSVPTADILALLSHINGDIYRRIVSRQVAAMAEQGWGEAPAAFDVIVMGSGGREENFLGPDQDNGFIIEDYPDDNHSRVDAWFAELAQRMSADLDVTGIGYCRGHVMASNPLWRKSLTQWQAQLTGWLQRPSTTTLRLADIFFDFRSVCGEGRFAARLREVVTAGLRHSHRFLQEMQAVQEGHGVALTAFRQRLAQERDGAHRGEINLKYHGLLPLVESVRLLALRDGVAETGTLVRLLALQRAGSLDGGEVEDLLAAHRLMTTLLLRQQIEDAKVGRALGPWIPIDALSRAERRELRHALSAVDQLHKRVRGEFTGDVFS